MICCPIPNCSFPVAGPLKICKAHYRLVPRPQQDALNGYAKHHKGGPAHRASFDRAVESVTKLIEARRPVQAVASEMPTHTKWWDD